VAGEMVTESVIPVKGV